MRKIWNLLKLTKNAEGADETFLHYYVKNSLWSIRFALVLAFAMYGLFGILDIYMAPESKTSIWFIRFYIVMPLVALTFAASFSKIFIHLSQTILLSISFIVGSGVLAMIICTNRDE